MIGIDVVDHTDPLLHPRGERAFRLISHPSDQHQIDNTLSLENLFWLYWAAKEATYKAHRLPKRFAPKTIPISLTQHEQTYYMKSGEFLGTLTQSRDATFCVCWKYDTEATPWYDLFKSSGKNQSQEVREHMINYLSNKSLTASMSKDWIGLPAVEIDQRKYLATFTHHHHLAGFICENPQA